MERKGHYSFRQWIIFLSILCFHCAPIAYSPHAQNEMVRPTINTGETQEIGAAFAYNKWMIKEKPDTVYIKTYPNGSISVFHNAYQGKKVWHGVGNIELIAFPMKWGERDASDFLLWLNPKAGMQYCGGVITARAMFSPVNLFAGFADGEFFWTGCVSLNSFYQISILLHNYNPSNFIYWLGARNSPRAIGLVAGYEHLFGRSNILRIEYSYLVKPPFSVLLTRKELEAIHGSVHYITAGFFYRISGTGN